MGKIESGIGETNPGLDSVFLRGFVQIGREGFSSGIDGRGCKGSSLLET